MNNQTVCVITVIVVIFRCFGTYCIIICRQSKTALNDFRTMALTSVVMKTFEKLLRMRTKQIH